MNEDGGSSPLLGQSPERQGEEDNDILK